MKNQRIRAYLYLTLVAAIWGIAGPVIKYTLSDFTPIAFLTYRFFLSSLFFIPFILTKGISIPKKGRSLFILLLISLLGSTINLGLLFYGYNYTTVLDATILSAIAPVFVVVGGALFLKENVNRQERTGIAIIFLGSLMIIFEPVSDISIFTLNNIFGNFLVIAANLAWVAYVLLSKYELKKKVEPLTIAFSVFLVGFLTLLPLSIIEAGGTKSFLNNCLSAPLPSHAGVLYMALLSGNLAYFLYQKGQKIIEASEATLFAYLSPFFAAPLAVFWLGESISPAFLTGALLIITGLVIAEYKKPQPARP